MDNLDIICPVINTNDIKAKWLIANLLKKKGNVFWVRIVRQMKASGFDAIDAAFANAFKDMLR